MREPPERIASRPASPSSAAERIARLRAFGLSDYASRAYLALLELGETEARDVSVRAGVPLAKIYQTLDQLQQRGFAVAQPTMPKRYAPVPIAEVLAKQRERHLEQVRELAHAEEELCEMFPVAPREAVSDRGSIVVVKGRQENVQALRKAVARAREDVLLAPSAGWLHRRRLHLDLLAEASARGVRVRLLLLDVPGVEEALADLGGAAVRLREAGLEGAGATSLVFVDGRAALVTHHMPDDASTARGKDVGIYVEEAGVVRALQSVVEASWAAAPEVRDQEDLSGPPPGFPGF
ncbi:MAG TPA: helix-turn-helix domain-containing protein [Candidatus Thermoplasmatota archaeon]|nr:helix-turn-helix domain-containing protein [Candidatus Thermoplasmatota archaeon]